MDAQIVYAGAVGVLDEALSMRCINPAPVCGASITGPESGDGPPKDPMFRVPAESKRSIDMLSSSYRRGEAIYRRGIDGQLTSFEQHFNVVAQAGPSLLPIASIIPEPPSRGQSCFPAGGDAERGEFRPRTASFPELPCGGELGSLQRAEGMVKRKCCV